MLWLRGVGILRGIMQHVRSEVERSVEKGKGVEAEGERVEGG